MEERIEMENILIFSIFAICAYNVKVLPQFNNSYFSKEQCNSLKAICALVVVLHHISHEIVTNSFLDSFSDVGYLATSVFFFISSYGITVQFKLKGKEYLDSFLKKRIISIVVPYIEMIILYGLYWHIRTKVDLKYILSSLINGHPVVANSWYIIVLIIFYLGFYISGRLSKGKKIRFIILIFGVWMVIFEGSQFLNYGIWWYNTAHCFVLGVIWACYEKNFLHFIRKRHYNILYLILLINILITLYKSNLERYYLCFDMIKSVLFVFLILLVCMKIQLGNKIICVLGKISFELYMIHGLIISVIEQFQIDKISGTLFVFLIIMFSIISAFAFNKLNCFTEKILLRKN